MTPVGERRTVPQRTLDLMVAHQCRHRRASCGWSNGQKRAEEGLQPIEWFVDVGNRAPGVSCLLATAHVGGATLMATLQGPQLCTMKHHREVVEMHAPTFIGQCAACPMGAIVRVKMAAVMDCKTLQLIDLFF